MNTTTKKTHIYSVTMNPSQNPRNHGFGKAVVHVRAESLAQARNFIASTQLEVVRATTDELLDLKRDDVIDATREATPDQAALPLEPTTGASDGEAVAKPEPFGADFIAAIQSDETAAQQLEPGHDAE